MTIFGANEGEAAAGTGRSSLGGGAGGLAVTRIGVGLVQGGLLWWLYNAADTTGSRELAWPATEPQLFGPLLLVALYLPFVLLAGVGRIRVVTLAVWTAIAAAALALLGWHDVARQAPGLRGDYPPFLDFPIMPFAAVALFIAHHLIAPADRERRWIASFPAYFDTAWKAGVQLVLSLGFTGVFWILLFLGAALFRIIGLKFLDDLLGREWFSIPVTCVAFAVAVHLTDVRDGLIRGVRTVALMLLSWLLLVITVLVAGFLAALPFTGLEGLWGTGSATSLVLSAAGALIILINTAYQDGEPDNRPPAILRAVVRVAAVLLTPLIAIAFWGLALRIGQHGLTPDRIIALCCAVVGAVYAGGYGYAALKPFWRKGDWMQPLERTNVVTAIMTVALIVALFTPLADPARLSVADQMARLERGAVTPDKFDYAFLRFESGKAGQAALERLTKSKNAEVARLAKLAQAEENRWAYQERVERGEVVIEMMPKGVATPAGFTEAVRGESGIYCSDDEVCVARLMDLNGDGVSEILLGDRYSVTLFARRNDSWVREGTYSASGCSSEGYNPRELLKTDKVQTAPSQWPSLRLGQIISTLRPHDPCSPEAVAEAAAPTRSVAR
ncbi:MAG TPA: DUF4153 domain-containing protein [Brevundimonas sp.]